MAGPGQKMANVNFSRYSSAVFEVAQEEMWRVFDWLHHHHYRHQPPAYVWQRLQESKGGMKRIKGKERAVLECQDDPATMDISLLYQLLQHTCGLEQDGSKFDWSRPRGEEEQQSLEHQLYLIKEKRNDLCHHPKQYMHLSDHKLDTFLQELQGLLCHSLRQAGQHSKRPTGEVDDAVASVRDRLAHIQASVPPSATTPQEFALLARTELQEQQEGLSSSGQRLSPPLLRWAVNAQVVTLDQLLQGPGREGEGPPRVLAVLGETGIGKSSLCRQMVEAWLQGEAWLQREAVEMVVVVELRQVFTRDLTRLLQEDFLPQTCLRCQPGEVMRLLGALRVLWLLDGFEEASADAKELLRRLVKWCSSSSGSHVVVVTCQPDYMEELNARLVPAATPCCVTHCGLTQQGFHSLLATLLQGDQEAAGEPTGGRVEEGGGREEEAQGEGVQGTKEAAGEEARGVFKVKQEQSGRSSSRKAGVEARCQAFLKEVVTLDPNLLGELHNPLKLDLAVQLWKEGRLREVAGAPLTQLYAAIQEALVSKLVARLRTKNSLTEAEARERLWRWVAALCEVALAMWGRGRFVVLDEEAEQLLKKQAIELLLPHTDCFSAFLTYRRGPESRHGFLHHTQQSVLAAQHLQTLLQQDHSSQEVMALLLPAKPTTATTTTDNTVCITETTNDTTTTDTTTSTTKTTTTDTTASTTITTSLNQAQDRLLLLGLDLDLMEELVEALKQATSQLTTVTDITASTIITTPLNQTQDRLSQLSLDLDHMEELVKVLKQETSQLTTATHTTASTIITTPLNQTQDRLLQLLPHLYHMEQLVEALKQETGQPTTTTTTDTTASTIITTPLNQAQDRLSKLSLRLDHMEQLVKVLKETTGQLTTTTTDTTASTTTTLDHCLGILVHAAASLAGEGSLSEGRAKVLAELLQQCRHCPWLEVVHRTACCPTLAREVRPRLEGLWEVTGPTVQAAAVLAAIRVPAVITITLHDNLVNLPHLMLLLQCLAKTPVIVVLNNLHSFFSNQPLSPCDSLLLPLCDPASLCQLATFTGALTAEGCRALWQQRHNLKALHVGVLEPAALEELVQLTHNTDRLKKVTISLYSIFGDHPSKSMPPGVEVHLHLPHVEDKEAEPAVALARRISHTFKSIVLGTASPSTVCSMVRAFRKERVRTPSLCREVMIQINNKRIVNFIHHFSLPLPTNMSLRDVYKLWKNLEMQVTVEVNTPP